MGTIPRFLEKRGLGPRCEGDLGPVYGLQWRHFGAEYKTCDTDYTGHGVDQLGECIRKIKEGPTDCRIIPSAWNPGGESCVSRVRTFQLMLVYSDATRGVATMPYEVPTYLRKQDRNRGSRVSCFNDPPTSVSEFHSISRPTRSSRIWSHMSPIPKHENSSSSSATRTYIEIMSKRCRSNWRGSLIRSLRSSGGGKSR